MRSDPIAAVVRRYGEDAKPAIVAGFHQRNQRWDTAERPMRLSRSRLVSLWRMGYTLVRLSNKGSDEETFEITALIS